MKTNSGTSRRSLRPVALALLLLASPATSHASGQAMHDSEIGFHHDHAKAGAPIRYPFFERVPHHRKDFHREFVLQLDPVAIRFVTDIQLARPKRAALSLSYALLPGDQIKLTITDNDTSDGTDYHEYGFQLFTIRFDAGIALSGSYPLNVVSARYTDADQQPMVFDSVKINPGLLVIGTVLCDEGLRPAVDIEHCYFGFLNASAATSDQGRWQFPEPDRVPEGLTLTASGMIVGVLGPSVTTGRHDFPVEYVEYVECAEFPGGLAVVHSKVIQLDVQNPGPRLSSALFEDVNRNFVADRGDIIRLEFHDDIDWGTARAAEAAIQPSRPGDSFGEFHLSRDPRAKNEIELHLGAGTWLEDLGGESGVRIEPMGPRSIRDTRNPPATALAIEHEPIISYPSLEGLTRFTQHVPMPQPVQIRRRPFDLSGIEVRGLPKGLHAELVDGNRIEVWGAPTRVGLGRLSVHDRGTQLRMQSWEVTSDAPGSR